MPAPIIMVHGAFCGGWAFDSFRAPFEQAGHAVHAIDLRGHGANDGASAVLGQSVGSYAADVAAFAKRFDTPPILVGHSLGGLVCALAASRVRAGGLLLLAPSAPWGVTGISMEETVSAVGLYSLGAYWVQAIEPDYSLAREYSLDRMPSQERRAIYRRMTCESGRALWETLNWWMDPFMTTRLSGPSSCPALVISGGCDRIHPVATVERTARILGAEHQTFPDMSHWLLGEPGWEEVADACLAWIARKEQAAAA